MKIGIPVSTFYIFLLGFSPAIAQTANRPPGDESINILKNQNGVLSVPNNINAGSACPANVPVGDTAVQFSGEVSTTNPNGITYEVRIRYSSAVSGGSMEHNGLETNLGSWTVSPGASETLINLVVTVTPAQSLSWAAELIASTAGTVFYEFQTFNNTIISRDELCTFEIIPALGTFSGTVFLDADSDSVQQNEEPGLPGQIVYIDGNGNQQYDAGTDTATITDIDGKFVFNLQPLPAELGLVVPGDWEQTYPADGFFTISEDGEEVDFGERPQDGAIFGAKWQDSNVDGKFDANNEPLLPGWTIYLDSNDNDSLDAGEPATVTDEYGRYQFTDLEAGTYVVREASQEAFIRTFPNDPGEHVVVLAEKQIVAGKSFGNVPRALFEGSLHGQVFENSSASDLLNGNPLGKDGIEVELLDSDGNLVDTAISMSMDLNGDNNIDAKTEQGLYWFEGIGPGNYTMRIKTLPDGTRLGYPYEMVYEVALQAGQMIEDLDFVLTTWGGIEGAKFLELVDRDQTLRRTLIHGVSLSTEFIAIEVTDASTGEKYASTLLSGESSRYGFNMPPGTYIVRERGSGTTLEDLNLKPVLPDTGGHRIVVESGEIVTADFINTVIGRISGTKYEDINGNGKLDLDIGESSIKNQKIRLTGPDGIVETVTDGFGDYSFDNIAANATYKVSEVKSQDSLASSRQTHPRLGGYIVPGVKGNIDFFNQPVKDIRISGEQLRQTLEESNALPENEAPRRIILDENAGKAGLKKQGGRGQLTTTIVLDSPLPAISRPVVIDGGGIFTLDGSNAGEGADGLVITGGGTDIIGLTISNFSGNAIVLDGAGRNRILNSVISQNGGDGIHVLSDSANSISGSAIFNNDGLGIDNGGDGPTTNDADDSDSIQNYPILQSVVNDTALVIQGMLTSRPDTTFLVEFFASPACDPSGRGEGESFIGSVSVYTDSTGNAVFTASLDTVLLGNPVVTATATAPDGSTSEFSACYEIITGVASDEKGIVPGRFTLRQNYPNPFNPSTTIGYELPKAARVRIDVFDVVGREVAVLLDEQKPAGRYELLWEPAGMASGVYFYRMQAGNFIQTRKLLLLK